MRGGASDSSCEPSEFGFRSGLAVFSVTCRGVVWVVGAGCGSCGCRPSSLPCPSGGGISRLDGVADGFSDTVSHKRSLPRAARRRGAAGPPSLCGLRLLWGLFFCVCPVFVSASPSRPSSLLGVGSPFSLAECGRTESAFVRQYESSLSLGLHPSADGNP